MNRHEIVTGGFSPSEIHWVVESHWMPEWRQIWKQVQRGFWRTTECDLKTLELCAHYLSEFLSRWLHGIGSLLIQLFFTQWGCVEGQNLLIIRLQLTTHLRETNQPFPLWKRERYATLLTIHIQNTSLVSLLMIQESVSLWFKNLKIYQDDKFYFRLHYILWTLLINSVIIWHGITPICYKHNNNIAMTFYFELYE